MADAEPEQEARRIEADPRLDRGEEIVDRHRLPSLAPDQVVAVRLQAEDVGGRVEPAKADEFDDALLAQPVDIQRPAATRNVSTAPMRCAGQIRPPVQRTSTSPSSATASDRHSGQ